MMTALQELFLDNYNPHCEQSIDEAMIPFQGRSSLKQYLPAKPIKRGIKVWCWADPHNGYLSELQVYTGRAGSGGREHNLRRESGVGSVEEVGGSPLPHVLRQLFHLGIPPLISAVEGLVWVWDCTTVICRVS